MRAPVRIALPLLAASACGAPAQTPVPGPAPTVVLRGAALERGGGAARWARTAGESGQARALALGPDGRVAIAGAFTGAVDCGGGPLPGVGGADLFVALYDRAGAHLWSQAFGGPLDDRATGIAFAPDGDLLITGE